MQRKINGAVLETRCRDVGGTSTAAYGEDEDGTLRTIGGGKANILSCKWCHISIFDYI
jgi:hypothetical protein